MPNTYLYNYTAIYVVTAIPDILKLSSTTVYDKAANYNDMLYTISEQEHFNIIDITHMSGRKELFNYTGGNTTLSEMGVRFLVKRIKTSINSSLYKKGDNNYNAKPQAPVQHHQETPRPRTYAETLRAQPRVSQHLSPQPLQGARHQQHEQRHAPREEQTPQATSHYRDTRTPEQVNWNQSWLPQQEPQRSDVTNQSFNYIQHEQYKQPVQKTPNSFMHALIELAGKFGIN